MSGTKRKPTNATRKGATTTRTAPPARAGRTAPNAKRRFAIAVGAIIAIAALFVVFLTNRSETSRQGTNRAGAYKFQVGEPGVGKAAPPVQLTATDGGAFDLAAQRNKTVMLYFQEGVGCQPCWDQIVDIQKHDAQFGALGIDEIVTITTNQLSDLRQKAADDGITIPVLSDPDLAVSKAYNANGYGMMGRSTDGHSFVVVGPDGMIRWRADYGGEPDYTMYVPIPNLIADLRSGLHGTTTR